MLAHPHDREHAHAQRKGPSDYAADARADLLARVRLDGRRVAPVIVPMNPRDAHEAPLAHESADDPRRHTGGPVVDVAGPLSRLTGNLFDADTMLPAPSVRAAALGQWFTPPWLAHEVVAALPTVDGLRVLEPSAGDGNIVAALLDAGARSVLAVEVDPRMCEKLRQRFRGERVDVVCADFLTLPISPESIDAIAGNPPYDKGMDTDHLERIGQLTRFGVQVSLLLRTVVLHSDERYRRVWSRLSVVEILPCVDRIPFLAAGGEPAEAGKIDVSVFRLEQRTPFTRVRWLREEVPA